MSAPCEAECGHEWAEGVLECSVCGREWNAVWPVCAPRLECPDCGYMNPNPERDEAA